MEEDIFCLYFLQQDEITRPLDLFSGSSFKGLALDKSPNFSITRAPLQNNQNYLVFTNNILT